MKICNETGVFMEKKRTVIKVGTSTLTYENGKINYRRVEQLCKVLSDLQNRGEQVIFVSSGAIAVGMGKAGLDKRPTETKKKQALAAIGQCKLQAADYATKRGVEVSVINGSNPENLYEVIDGNIIGTKFLPVK